MIAVAYSEVLQNVCGRWVSIQHPWMTQSNREGTSPIISLLLDRFGVCSRRDQGLIFNEFPPKIPAYSTELFVIIVPCTALKQRHQILYFIFTWL